MRFKVGDIVRLKKSHRFCKFNDSAYKMERKVSELNPIYGGWSWKLLSFRKIWGWGLVELNGGGNWRESDLKLVRRAGN